MKIYFKDLSPSELLNQSGIYKIVNEANGNWYVGSTSTSFNRRFRTHRRILRNGTHANKHLQNAYNKYGEGEFSFVVIKICSPEIALVEEQKILDVHFLKSYCYNISRDASSPMKGRKHTAETLKKISISSKANGKRIGELTRMRQLGTKHSPESIEKMKKSACDRDDTKRIAVLKSQGHREKLSKIMKGKKWTPEQRIKQLSIMHSEEYRKKVSDSTKGIPKSSDMKSKVSKARLGKSIILLHEDGREEQLLSLRDFCERKYHLNRHEISALINGKRDEYKGWRLKP